MHSRLLASGAPMRICHTAKGCPFGQKGRTGPTAYPKGLETHRTSCSQQKDFKKKLPEPRGLRFKVWASPCPRAKVVLPYSKDKAGVLESLNLQHKQR